jgi:hypothetical protein
VWNNWQQTQLKKASISLGIIRHGDKKRILAIIAIIDAE